ncbi:MAG: hypothetical protein R3253_09480, partial [Longimicrobiales bacterium]|nr:hypothetical protein [Longimicrobiales bacterium]
GYLGDLAFQAPRAAILPAVIVVVFMAFFLGSNPTGPRWTKWLVGVVWMAIAALVFYLPLFYLVRTSLSWWLVLVVYGLAAGFLAGVMTGLGLWLVNRLWGWNNNEVFSCQSIRDFKSFLRCNITSDGELHIYPIGIERVPRRWRKRRSATPHDDDDELPPILVPVEDRLVAHLLEPPIVVPSSGRRG